MLTTPQRYVLPLTVLLETLRSWHEPLTLSARLPRVPEFGTEKATAFLHVADGRIHACTLFTPHGQVLAQQQAALTHLTQMENVEWLVTSSEAATEVYRPCRMHETARVVMPTTLSQRHRQVLLLMDGRKSVPELARVLRLPPHEIEALLLDLQQHHVLL